MPRKKVPALLRRRVARACISCKRRKERCSGSAPCEQCLARRRGEDCQYTVAASASPGPNTSRPLLCEATGSSNDRENEIDQALNALEDLTTPADAGGAKEGVGSFLDAAPLPQSSRMLRDSRGKFIYVGESASLSFLQIIRKAFGAAVGDCDFTTDPLRHLMIETSSTVRYDRMHEPTLNLEEGTELAYQFFMIASGIMDLFDPAWLIDALPAWIADSTRSDKLESSVFYLALAIGAQARARDEIDDNLAERCFGYGRQLAMFTLMDNPSLLTVQAFILITYYMIAACRRNGAFTNLGVAVRAAYALGIHRHETNILFIPEEGIARERAWKTLRVCDLFLSASMGRPPATSETDCSIPWASLQPAKDGESSVSSQVSSAIFRICHVFERVLVEVYTRRAVSLELAGSISGQLKEWTEELPCMLKIDGLDESNQLRAPGLSHRLGSGIVTMAYYYSIILLTRPFLTFKVCHVKKVNRSGSRTPSHVNLNTYADACIDSAIKGIDIAHEIVFEENMPRRQPLVINSVFISALCLGLAYLDDYDRRGWALDRSLERGIAILKHFGRLNPQSARYAEICRLLQMTASTYTNQRDSLYVQSSSHLVRNVFGDVRHAKESDTGLESRDLAQNNPSQSSQTWQRSLSSATPRPRPFEPISPASFNDNLLQQESMITTSGTLTGHFDAGGDYQYQEDPDLGGLSQSLFFANASHTANGYNFRDPLPLFSLTNDLSTSGYIWQE